MKHTKILLLGSVAGVVALLSASVASAAPAPNYPPVRLTFSGTVTVPVADTNGNDITVTNGAMISGKLKTVSFNNKTLITLLNASPTVQAYITNYTGSTASNSIPAGSYFVWDMNSWDVWVTNANHFSIDLDTAVSFEVGFDYDEVIGSYKLDDTGAGTENDTTGAYVYFNDSNGNELYPYGGLTTFNWTYGSVSGNVNSGTQKKTINVRMAPAAYEAEVSNAWGITTSFTVSGSGSGTNLTSFGYVGEPFFYWY